MTVSASGLVYRRRSDGIYVVVLLVVVKVPLMSVVGRLHLV